MNVIDCEIGKWFVPDSDSESSSLFAGCLKITDWGHKVYLVEAGTINYPPLIELVRKTANVLNSKGKMLTFMVSVSKSEGIFSFEQVIVAKSGKVKQLPERESKRVNDELQIIADSLEIRSVRYVSVVTSGWSYLDRTQAQPVDPVAGCDHDRNHLFLRCIRELGDFVRESTKEELISTAYFDQWGTFLNVDPVFVESVALEVHLLISQVGLAEFWKQEGKAKFAGYTFLEIVLFVIGFRKPMELLPGFSKYMSRDRVEAHQKVYEEDLRVVRQKFREYIPNYDFTQATAVFSKFYEAFMKVSISTPLDEFSRLMNVQCSEDHLFQYLHDNPLTDLTDKSTVHVIFSAQVSKSTAPPYAPPSITPPCINCAARITNSILHVYGNLLCPEERHVTGYVECSWKNKQYVKTHGYLLCRYSQSSCLNPEFRLLTNATFPPIEPLGASSEVNDPDEILWFFLETSETLKRQFNLLARNSLSRTVTVYDFQSDIFDFRVHLIGLVTRHPCHDKCCSDKLEERILSNYDIFPGDTPYNHKRAAPKKATKKRSEENR
jgi:hypothetical protein